MVRTTLDPPDAWLALGIVPSLLRDRLPPLRVCAAQSVGLSHPPRVTQYTARATLDAGKAPDHGAVHGARLLRQGGAMCPPLSRARFRATCQSHSRARFRATQCESERFTANKIDGGVGLCFRAHDAARVRDRDVATSVHLGPPWVTLGHLGPA